jgi:hypothetical protein
VPDAQDVGAGLVEHGLAIRDVIDASHDLEQARLAGTVRADDADLGARQEGQRHVVEDDLVAMRLASLAEGVDELGHGTRA